MKNKNLSGFLLLAALLLAVSSAGICLGSVPLSLTSLFSLEYKEILFMRLSRVVLGLVAGAGLAVAGVIFQGILRNPLAEPYVLGVSSGAGLGAVLGMFFSVGILFIPWAAFIGAALTMVLVYQLAKIHGNVSTEGLLLSGVIVGAVFSSLLLFFVSISPNEGMHGITWWLLGSLQVFEPTLLYMVGGIVLFGILCALYFARDLNAMILGEEEAMHLGIRVETVRKILFVVASLITGSIVCVCGIIGFVGLIVPHAMRLVFGVNHRLLIPASALAAAIFLIVSDTISRVVIPPVEMPIGVITTLIGGPLFIILLRKKNKIQL
jgi:iron complex transport system permease protein